MTGTSEESRGELDAVLYHVNGNRVMKRRVNCCNHTFCCKYALDKGANTEHLYAAGDGFESVE